MIKATLVLLNLIVYAVGVLNGVLIYRVINSGETVPSSIPSNLLIYSIISSVLGIGIVVYIANYLIPRLKKIVIKLPDRTIHIKKERRIK